MTLFPLCVFYLISYELSEGWGWHPRLWEKLMGSSVLNVNGLLLKEGYNKEEGDKLVTTLIKKRSSQCNELGVIVLDLFMPNNSSHDSPYDAIHDLVQIVKTYYPKRHPAVVWKKDTVSFMRYRDRRQFNDSKLRYRLLLIIDQTGYNDFEFVFKYTLKTWAELHGFKLKDVFRNRWLLGGSERYDYLISRTGNEPVELTTSHILSYINPMIKPKLV